ncbi:LysR family transcriptional regulator [Hornefia butyriciproducens]|uniref:LysR family transcriptional regulator n=1 Tax=Hornefia butyriciproducens TaxID=2652293 RepID=A0A6L5Y5V5_9FIRM|nr:LysR family transcriptional regulator [Hornefia butyriciproducens]MST51855.1 LysR family transcriptional regulator [Hornefia butyriciproducens]
MYNPLLDTFLAVADSGSFTRAADRLYISPTAVMKQMNALEKHLDLKLIERSPAGAHLTEAGRIIYRNAKFLIDYSRKSVEEAMAATRARDTTFCVGTSLLNPAKPFMDLWYRVNKDFPDYRLHLVPFEDDHNGILSEIDRLGGKFDFLIGVCDSRTWMSLCSFQPLGRYKKMVAVSREHRLASRTQITVEDLYGETLMMVPRGDSGTNDFIRNDLETNHPEIHIEDTSPFYDLSVFNRCAETGNVLLTIECWQHVHPGLVSIPVAWEYSIPYGLLYSLNAPDDVLRFVDAAATLHPED